MFKKWIILFTLLTFFSGQAFANSADGLKIAFDELNYSLTVEWDQKNQGFYDEQMNRFVENLKSLQDQGMTKNELISFVKTSIKDERMVREIESTFKVIELRKLSPQEAAKLMGDTMRKNSYHRGASWNGTLTVVTTIGTLIVIGASIVLAGWVYQRNHDCSYGGSCHYDILTAQTICKPGCFN